MLNKYSKQILFDWTISDQWRRQPAQERVHGAGVRLSTQAVGAEEDGGRLVVAHARNDHDRREKACVQTHHFRHQLPDKLAVRREHAHSDVKAPDAIIKGVVAAHEQRDVLFFRGLLVQGSVV